MYVTTIRHETPDLIFLNTICHECTCGEFLQDIREEVRKYKKEHEQVSQVDLYWHLDSYCDGKYGPCHWQLVHIRSLLSLVSD